MGHKTHKKPTTVKEVPPSPDSSSDDQDSAVESSDDEQPSPTPSLHHTASSKKPSFTTVTKLPSPEPQSGSDDDDDDSEDDDDVGEDEIEETQTPTPPPQPKPTSKPTPSKRPADSEHKAAVPEKKHKNDKDKPSPSPGNSKGLFEKVWSPEDEVVILNKILEFKSEKGCFGTANHGEVLESIRDKLSVPDPKKEQLTNKLRGLKDRYLKLKSGKRPFRKPPMKSPAGPTDELVLKVGDLVWGEDASKTKSNGNLNGNSTKKDKKAKDKGKEIVREAKEEIVEEERPKEEQKSVSCNEVGGGEGSDSDDGIEFDVEYMKSTNEIIKVAMKKMSEEERDEANAKLRKADAMFKEAYCLKLEVLLMAFKKNAGLA